MRRLLRRREWAVVHPGVYADHTGALTWVQRAWAAVLTSWPAALCHDSALRALDGPSRLDRLDADVIHVAVDRDRCVRVPPRVVLHRLSHFDERVQLNTSPPRVRVEHAAIDVAAGAVDESRAVAVLAGVVQSRHTTAPRLLEVLGSRSRIARRPFLADVLTDVAAGTCSVLEREYLDRVERPHGLPLAARQVHQSARGSLYRDVLYEPYELAVELDGRLFHDSASSRDHDLERDLDASLDGLTTVRLGWGQVHRRACLTATKLARLLGQRGWEGPFLRCPRCPLECGDLQSPADSESPHSALLQPQAGVPLTGAGTPTAGMPRPTADEGAVVRRSQASPDRVRRSDSGAPATRWCGAA